MVKIKLEDIPGAIKILSEALVKQEDAILEASPIKDLPLLDLKNGVPEEWTEEEIKDLDETFECPVLEIEVDRYYCKHLCENRNEEICSSQKRPTDQD